MVKISIITPTYNRGSLLKRTINSVISQTFTDWELLIIDDGSTDNTKNLVDEFLKDPRIKYFYQENSGGPASPRNFGVQKASGEFIAFLDSDDEWLPEKLEKQLAVFENSKDDKLGLVSCYVIVKDDNTNNIVDKYNISFRDNVIKEIIKGCFVFSTSGVMTRLDILKEVGNFDEQFKTSDDWDMWIRISKAGYKFDYVTEYLLNYFIHDKNIYYNNNKYQIKKEFFVICEKYKELFIKYSYFSLGRGYFIIKNYKTSRKYFIRSIFFKNSSIRERIKSIGYVILTFYPNNEDNFQKIWRVLKKN